MRYRAEIDGLRAIAVLMVVLFHAGFDAFRGGYIGVDLFFVISGFLITTIILQDLAQGRFSLSAFYERRARRILPALLLVVTATLPFAWWWLPPAELTDYAQSVVGITLFSSNFLFWQESGYWESASALKPLLHTWSLAVEEQYYLFFPLMMVWIWRCCRGLILTLLLAMVLLSVGYAQWQSAHDAAANFYLLPSRLWELMLGGAIAYLLDTPSRLLQRLRGSPVLSEGLVLLGVVMVGAALLTFDASTPFPGLYGLIPTLGVGLILAFSSAQRGVGHLLGSRPLVGIGLISYSLYLWHQPLLALAHHRSLVDLDGGQRLALVGLALLLAYLSWRFVEQPFRQRGRFSRAAIFGYGAAVSLLLLVLGVVGQLEQGWAGRFEAPIVVENRSPRCKGKQFSAEQVCTLVEGEERVAFLMGDSHAAVFAHEMREALEPRGLGLIHIYASGCPPLLGVYRADNPAAEDLSCYQFNNGLYRFIEEHPEIETVVLAARWTLSMEGSRFDNHEGGVERSPVPFEPHLDLVDGEGVAQYHPDYGHRQQLAERFATSIQRLLALGKRVILIYPVPEAGWHVPNYLTRYRAYVSDQPFAPEVGSTSHARFSERNRNSYAALDGIGEHPNLYRVYPERLFCSTTVAGRCLVHQQGEPLYRDDDHLSSLGSAQVVAEILRHY